MYSQLDSLTVTTHYGKMAAIMKEIITNKVQTLRTNAGLTQEELASRVGVSRQTIIAIEKGNYTPSVLLALKIAAVFTEPIEKIFTITYEK